MPIATLDELLAHHLQKIDDAEAQASGVIGTATALAESKELQRLLQTRAKQGDHLRKDVAGFLKSLGVQQTKSSRNLAAQGILEEARTLMNEVDALEMKEAVVIGGVQELEHYCIAVWGTVKALAGEAGQQKVVDVMQRALDEGYELDRALTALAETRVNPEAAEASDDAEGDAEAS